MIITEQNIGTDNWVKVSWEEFLALANEPKYEKAKFYYYQGYMRVEMSPVGPRHGRRNSIIPYVVAYFAAIRNIVFVEFSNTSFRKAGLDEFQPDVAFYIGSDLKIPDDSDSPVDLNQYDPPTLVVEIAASSLSEDLGRKRLLYERANVREYWVVDAIDLKVIAFGMGEGRSGEIKESQVLPGLSIAIVEEAVQRSREGDNGEILRWLIQTFS
ncbi:Uma2 family endonuclease [Ancylothrix sp. C2]|uniref:Uma2 family endonuclease n=1 Tax=Ancylothrix sp. D3o TaxID=2953691 RepID=UPI0021BAD55F|nr:Uma2 family endonuclease [Ancylothrix sp. D3o]MCT7949357.1 Uma2 family endonuclease [Ancylothrix sp. D3o]